MNLEINDRVFILLSDDITADAIRKINYKQIFISRINRNHLYKQILKQYDNSYTKRNDILMVLTNSIIEYSDKVDFSDELFDHITILNKEKTDEELLQVFILLNKGFLKYLSQTNSWLFEKYILKRPTFMSLPDLRENDELYDKLFGKLDKNDPEDIFETSITNVTNVNVVEKFSQKQKKEKFDVNKKLEEWSEMKEDIQKIKDVNKKRSLFMPENWMQEDINQPNDIVESAENNLRVITKRNGGLMDDPKRFYTTRLPHHHDRYKDQGAESESFIDSLEDKNHRSFDMTKYTVKHPNRIPTVKFIRPHLQK